MAYIGGEKVLLFGGKGGPAYRNDTWVYNLNTNTWTDKNPQGNKPLGRYIHDMAYISEGKVLLFGGSDGSNRLGDTWVYELDANAWIDKDPQGNKPSGRDGPAMAYIGGERVLLFGGNNGSNKLDDTWVYQLNANTWNQDTNASQPSARAVHTLSETSMDGSSYLVLFGGVGSNPSFKDDTWTFGGVDTTPPEIRISVEPDKLWPPNHKMQTITASVTVTDDSDPSPTVVLASIVSNEPDNGLGDGDKPNDIQDAEIGEDDYEFSLRAERSGGGDGRIYTITYTATDASGNSQSTSATVTVPHDKGKGKSAPGLLAFSALSAYPQPCNPEAWIPYTLANDVEVTIAIYNSSGRITRTLKLGHQKAGAYISKSKAAYWDGHNNAGESVASGIYFYHLQAGDFSAVRRMLMVK